MSRYFDLCCWPSTPSNILRLRIGSQCNATSNLRNKWKYDIVKNDSEILDISSIWWRSNHSGPRGSKIFEKYLHCLNHPYTQPQTKASSNLMKQIKSILKWQESGGGLLISLIFTAPQKADCPESRPWPVFEGISIFKITADPTRSILLLARVVSSMYIVQEDLFCPTIPISRIEYHVCCCFKI